MQYPASTISEYIYNEGMTEGRAKGMTEGRAEGVTEGRAEGMTEGLAKGLVKGKIETLENLFFNDILSKQQFKEMMIPLKCELEKISQEIRV